MLAAALRDGSAHRRTTFEVFARRLPEGRRYGVVAGTARFVEALAQFRFDDTALASLEDFLDRETLAYLADYRFRGDVDGYAEGELYFPGSPVLSVHGTFGECVVLETLALSIFNHDTAIASAAARMVSRGRRAPTDRDGLATHPRAGRRRRGTRRLHRRVHGVVEPRGPAPLRRAGARHQRSCVHAAAHHGRTRTRRAGRVQGTGRRARRRHHAARRHLRHHAGVANAVEVAGTELGAVRIDSGDLGVLARQVREQLDGLGANKTRIVVSGDLDEFAIAALRAEPVDIYGVGTSVVTGSGAPTASMVYKLVEVDGMPVEKRSSHKESHGGRKQALRRGQAVRHHRRGGRPPVSAGHRRISRAGPSRSTWCAGANRSATSASARPVGG